MEIKYVYFLCHPRSPYRKAYSSNDLERIVREDFIKIPTWKPDEVIKRAIEKYESFQTISTRILISARIGAEKLADYFENVDFTEMDRMGKPVYTAKDLASNLSAVGNIIKSIISLEKQVEAEQSETNVRGKAEINDYEIPGQE